MSLRLLCRALIIPVLVTAMSACQWRDGHVVLGDTEIHPPTPTQLAWTETTHRVAFPPGRAELSASEAGAIEAFLAGADIGPGDRVVVLAEAGAPMADQRLQAVRRYLQQLHVPAAVGRQPETALGRDEVALNVGRYRAVGLCADWDRAVAGGGINGDAESYGCTTAAARAAHAVDPGDLLGGNPVGDADGERLAKGIQAYRSGESGRQTESQAIQFIVGSD